MNFWISEYFPLNFFGAPLVPGIGKFMTPVSGAIVGDCVKVVVVGGGETIAIELDWDSGVESGRLEVSEIGLEVVEGVLGPEFWSLGMKSMGKF